MKFSMRVKLVSIVAMLVMMLASSAWGAWKDEVEGHFAQYNSSHGGEGAFSVSVDETNKIVTITGSVTDTKLPLTIIPYGEIVTFKWDATLTGDRSAINWGSEPTPNYTTDSLVRFFQSENLPVVFEINGGRIALSDTGASGQDDDVCVIHSPRIGSKDDEVYRNNTIIVNGGTVESDIAGVSTILFSSIGKLTINGGNISATRGMAIDFDTEGDGTLELNDYSGITGLVSDSNVDSVITAYGICVLETEDELDMDVNVTVAKGAEFTLDIPTVKLVANYSLTISADATMIIAEGTTFTNYGSINIYGTLTNVDKIVNEGTINNNSGKTLDNQGTFTNNGTVNNTATGRVKNSGTFTNAATATYKNEGVTENTGTFKSNAANFSGNPVEGKAMEPLNSNSDSGGGGCNVVGYGVIALLLAAVGLVMRKSRKA